MKKTLILMSMMLMVGLSAQAQRGGGQGGQRGQRMSPEASAKAQAEKFQEEFGLSDEQYKKTYDVLLASAKTSREKMSEMRESGSFDREAMQKMISELQTERETKLKEIFSATQWTAYEKWKKENPQRFGGGRRGGGRGGN